MKKNKILPLLILLLGVIYLFISLTQVITRSTGAQSTDTSDSPQQSEITEAITTVSPDTSETSSPSQDETTKDITTTSPDDFDTSSPSQGETTQSPETTSPSVTDTPPETTTPECSHRLSSTWSSQDGYHYRKCTVNGCSYIEERAECSGGTATCRERAICAVCNAYYGPLGDHTWNTEYDYTEAGGHAHRCTVPGCTEHSEITPHVPGAEATESSPQICTECDYVIVPTLNHVHKTKKINALAPTCTSSGNKEYYVCKGCSRAFEDKDATKEISDLSATYAAPLGHDFADATCTSPKTCKRSGCNATEGTPLGHNHAEKLSSDATSHWHVCTVCNAQTDRSAHVPGPEATESSPQICRECNYVIVPTLNHVHRTEKVNTVSPTCTSAGSKEHYVCTGCSKKFEDKNATKEITDLISLYIAPTGHDYSAATCSAPKTCKRSGCGATEGSALEHDYASATCTSPMTCKRSGCNATSGAPLGHDYASATCTSPKTCKRNGCGATEGSALGHTPSGKAHSDALYHWHVCGSCGTELSRSAHVPGPEATESSPQICRECNYVIVPTLDHVHKTEKVNAVSPTCTSSGSKEHYVCTGCSKKFEDKNATKEITDVSLLYVAPVGHDYSAATCSAPKTCKRSGCGATEGSALGHDYASATCTSPKTCKRSGCNATEGAPLGHDYASATCTSPKTCKRSGCGAADGSALGHASSETVYSDSTYHWHICNACGIQINKTAHVPGAEATETTAQICVGCGYVIKKPLGHTHKYGQTAKYDSNVHWFECTCGQKKDISAHIDSNKDARCDVCAYSMPIETTKPPETTKEPETTPPPETTQPPETTTDAISQEGSVLDSILRPAQITLLRPVASGVLTKSNTSAIIDYSNFKDGYVMVKFTANTSVLLKVQVQGPTTTYTYNIIPQEWTVFPLSDGNGNYSIKVYKNVIDNKYATVLSLTFTATLSDEFAPFLRPNQYVNYENAINSMEKAAELATGKTDTLSKVEAIYSYVINNISYDYEKAATVQSGYLPDLDQVLAEKKGICFDYAALMTGMLRSQNIACKLVIGYANTAYHAWINVWTPERGWVDGAIFFDGTKWQIMDPTYASSTGSAIINKVTYTSKYVY